jgi:lipopolysaccharide export LptBFGC system permease protein LptF
MKNGICSFNIVTKKLLIHFGIASSFVFALLFIDEIVLIINYLSGRQVTKLNAFFLIIYSIPPIFILSFPYGVCIGFTQGLMKENFNIKYLFQTFFWSIIIIIIIFFSINIIFPILEEKKSTVHNEINIANNVICVIKSPPIQSFKENKDNKKLYNIYLIELGKKYSIPCSTLFFTFFALCLSIVLGRHYRIALGLSILLCFFHFILLYFFQNISVLIGAFGFLFMWFPNIIIFVISIILYYLKKKSSVIKQNIVKGFNGT